MRPFLLDEKAASAICSALARGESKVAAARRAKVSVRTLHRWWATGLDALVGGDRSAPEARLVVGMIRARRAHFGALIGQRP